MKSMIILKNLTRFWLIREIFRDYTNFNIYHCKLDFNELYHPLLSRMKLNRKILSSLYFLYFLCTLVLCGFSCLASNNFIQPPVIQATLCEEKKSNWYRICLRDKASGFASSYDCGRSRRCFDIDLQDRTASSKHSNGKGSGFCALRGARASNDFSVYPVVYPLRQMYSHRRACIAAYRIRITGARCNMSRKSPREWGWPRNGGRTPSPLHSRRSCGILNGEEPPRGNTTAIKRRLYHSVFSSNIPPPPHVSLFNLLPQHSR